MVYMIDSIRFNDLEEAFKELENAHSRYERLDACGSIIDALGGGSPARAPEMIRYLLEQEKKRISTPR